MKYFIYSSILSFFILTTSNALADEEKLSLSGFYQQKNLFVQNQIGQDGFGYAIRNIYINGNVYHADHNSRAIEIDFNALGIRKGEPVEVLIAYEGKKPRILNPQSILPESTCSYKSVTTRNDFIQFSTLNENGALNFYIQHFRWNKWINVGEVMGDGTPNENQYRFLVNPNSGENLYRIVQIKHSGSYNISPIVSLQGPTDEVTFDKEGKTISFSRPTYFEVHDIFGNLLQKGYSEKIQLKEHKGIGFYLSFDNSTELIKK